MKKRLFIVFIILVFLCSIAIFYLNNVILPIKIKSLIVTTLAEQTQKKVTLESLKFSIFKGLVLRNLTIYDDTRALISLKEASCVFLIPPIFQRKIVIPSLNFNSPEIFLQRRKDSTFNLQDLFPNKAIPQAKQNFGIFVYKVRLTDATLHFQDDTIAPSFRKNIENLNANLNLALPASVRFRLRAEIPSSPPINISATGEFNVPQQQLLAKVSLENFSPKEFLAYYQNLGIDITNGLIDCGIDLELKEKVLHVNLQGENKNLNISKDNIQAVLNAQLESGLQYNLADKQLKFSGKAAITDSQILGLEFVDVIKDINGEVTFSNSGILADKLYAGVLGIPIQAKIKLDDFSHPFLKADVASSLSMPSLQNILKDKLKITFPADIQGGGNLFLSIQTKIPLSGPLEINGYLDIVNAILKLEKISSPVESINGRVEFNFQQLKWANLNFKYLGIPYTTQGTLTNFQAPEVWLKLSSKDLSLESVFAISNNLIKFSKFTGKYLNSDFRLSGDINAKAVPKVEADIGGELNINLEDIKEPLKKFKNQLEQIRPQGLMQAQFNLSGNINDIKSCTVTARLLSPSISAYGLKAQDLVLNLNQQEGLIDIPSMHLSLYDGNIGAVAKINLNAQKPPYWLNADIQGVKIEKLKLDTAARGKDIAGTFNAQVKLNGFSNDLSKLNGTGTVNVTEGKLWQLNLFKGLGSLLFGKDFANIVFNEGSCGFTIQDKRIWTDDLKLKSNITNLSGSVKIGFDSSIDAVLNVDILDENAPLTGTLKDVATTILGQAGRFGVIKITGTVKEPKYKFQPAVVDIIKGLKDVFFKGEP